MCVHALCSGWMIVCRRCLNVFTALPPWDYTYVCVFIHMHAARVYHRLCLRLLALTRRINVSSSVRCEEGTDLSPRGNEGRDKWGGKRSSLSVEEWGCEYCHPESLWEWHFASGVRNKRGVEEKPSKRLWSMERQVLAGALLSGGAWLCVTLLEFNLSSPAWVQHSG